jgi:hypothetical protein
MDPRLEEIKAKDPADLTESDAVYLDGHLAGDLFANYIRATAQRVAQFLTPLVEEGMGILKAAESNENRLSEEQGERLSFLVTQIYNIETQWQSVLRSQLEWTMEHGEELVGPENYARVEELLQAREARQAQEDSVISQTEAEYLFGNTGGENPTLH